jgi:threonine/homoserine/homoserine lactone efflux protein
MPSGSTMLLFLGTSALLLAFPGPAVIFLVTRSAEQGRAAGVVSLLGVETGTLIYALAAAAGLAGVIAASATAFAAVKYLGAAYLLYLGVQRLRGRHAQGASAHGGARPRSRLYASGLAVQLLNPKIAVFFVAFLPQFAPRHGSPAVAMLALGCAFTLLALLSDGLYVLVAGALGERLRASFRARRFLDRATGLVYAALGISAALAGAGPRHDARR